MDGADTHVIADDEQKWQLDEWHVDLKETIHVIISGRLVMSITRRRFLQTTSATAATIGTDYFVNPTPAQESKSPNERLNIASVGTVSRGEVNLRGVASQNIVAMADIDANSLERAQLFLTTFWSFPREFSRNGP